ncbi:hypothetical protein HH212_22890 [Massilia forsythiae]|uniref:Uncharacterized protein n=1 Tax=Massilia forsythiae TaxID=2728020 RepID=A0A7Z2ZUK7_9BURK|nr:hypothetical protein [Massilia forsythiae]QJE02514.1 hypothetical protein HH212_22890 [Massilia forsythiae]
MDADLFQKILCHPKTRRLSDFEWENACEPKSGARFQLAASVGANGQPAFALRRWLTNGETVVVDVTQTEVSEALLAGKPWIATILKVDPEGRGVIESPDEKAEKFILESISFGDTTASIIFERGIFEEAAKEEFRLLLRSPKLRPKQQYFSLISNDMADAVSRGEPMLLRALQNHVSARLAFLSEDAAIFSAAEAASIGGSAHEKAPKRGPSSL